MDHMADLRAEIVRMLETVGLDPRQQHHDPAPGQSQISLGLAPLKVAADAHQAADQPPRKADKDISDVPLHYQSNIADKPNVRKQSQAAAIFTGLKQLWYTHN